MIRVIFNDGIMERRTLEIHEYLPAGDKLNSELWRRINDEAMWLAAEVGTGIVGVFVCRVKDGDDPLYRDGLICTPYGERICDGLASRRMVGVDMIWCLPGQRRSWTYRSGGGRNYYD